MVLADVGLDGIGVAEVLGEDSLAVRVCWSDGSSRRDWVSSSGKA